MGRPAGARWPGRVAPGHELLQHVEIDRLDHVMVEPGLDHAAATLVVAGAAVTMRPEISMVKVILD
jgi:hypothetical protein